MRYSRSILAVVVCSLVVAMAAPPQWPGDAAALERLGTRLVQDWMEAVSAKDEARLERIMRPCFQRMSFEGAFDRAAEIAKIKTLDAKDAKVTDVVATRSGDALVVTCRIAVSEGKLDLAPSWRLGVWQPESDGWGLACWATLHMPSERIAPSAPRVAENAALDAEGRALVTRLLRVEQSRDTKGFGELVAPGAQALDFSGRKPRERWVEGISSEVAEQALVSDARATTCGGVTVVTCTVAMARQFAALKIPAEPAPMLVVFSGSKGSERVIASADAGRPRPSVVEGHE